MVRFWLAAHAPVPADTMQWLSDTAQSVPWPAVLLVLLVLDAVAMHQARWRRRAWWQLAGFVAGAAVVAVALGWALSGAIRPARPAPTAFIVLPPWHQLPLFAVLRAIPNKLMAVSAVLAMPLLPLAWPWVRADRLRAGRARWIWAALCGALALAWIGLGYLGSRPADDATLIAARALTIFHFTFFLAVPFVLHRVARTP
jgi:quinol-cytochrome oxidoreductase complex cytochrome b subunit